MTSAERFAIKLLIDQAKRAALTGRGVHRARLYGGTEHSPGSTLLARPLRVVRDTGSVHDESWDDAELFRAGVVAGDLGANFRGNGRGLPSSRRRVA
jgi:hypothetical protein